MKHSTRQHRYTIAYDLTDDRERRRVDRFLKGWGHRVQKSVFLIMANRYGIKTLKDGLDKLSRLLFGNWFRSLRLVKSGLVFW